MESGGSIVNISSAAARSGGAVGGGHYAVAKAGVGNFTRALAKEVAPKGIRVNSVEPGIINTRFQDDFTLPDAREKRRNLIPMKREGSPAEVAKVVSFLATEESSYMTGAAVQVTGGIAMI
jgi:3-oxoacyl-[acyl-carrier protein] reductase